MNLPRFFSRVADAIGPVATVRPEALAAHLNDRRIAIRVPDHCDGDPGLTDGTLLAVNLAARLYPRLRLNGPPEWTDRAAVLATSINPAVDLRTGTTASMGRPDTAALLWDDLSAAHEADHHVRVSARGWNIVLDTEASTEASHPLAVLAASALGIGELFRVVFADSLGARGRRGPQPGGFNLVTAGTPQPGVPLRPQLEIPDVHLIGAGAVGQACLLSLGAADVRGRVFVVDPETIELSNLQRYVLTTDVDERVAKTTIAARFAEATGLVVTEIPTRWGEDHRSGPGTRVALVALDSATDRIGVAASMPDRVYNAWTQPADTGWSRHERFGSDPCLACLYFPHRQRPHEYQLIAAALQQPPLRVLSYLVTRQPVGSPLPMIVNVPDIPTPSDAGGWMQQSLLTDLVDAGYVDVTETEKWSSRPIGAIYRDGVCAGGFLRPPDKPTGEAALVPLAHQSALAGVMLAVQLVAAFDDQLRSWRPTAVEGRLDQLSGLPQVLPRPRSKATDCICSDTDFLTHRGASA